MGGGGGGFGSLSKARAKVGESIIKMGVRGPNYVMEGQG